MTKKRGAEKAVRDIRRATRRFFSAEEKIGIALEGLQSNPPGNQPGRTQPAIGKH